MPEFLTTNEFQRWAESDRDFKNRILDHVDNQALVNADVQAEIAVMKSTHTKARNFNAGLSTVISALVSGVVTAFTAGK